jgi:hypothetical protein
MKPNGHAARIRDEAKARGNPKRSHVGCESAILRNDALLAEMDDQSRNRRSAKAASSKGRMRYDGDVGQPPTPDFVARHRYEQGLVKDADRGRVCERAAAVRPLCRCAGRAKPFDSGAVRWLGGKKNLNIAACGQSMVECRLEVTHNGGANSDTRASAEQSLQVDRRAHRFRSPTRGGGSGEIKKRRRHRHDWRGVLKRHGVYAQIVAETDMRDDMTRGTPQVIGRAPEERCPIGIDGVARLSGQTMHVGHLTPWFISEPSNGGEGIEHS